VCEHALLSLCQVRSRLVSTDERPFGKPSDRSVDDAGRGTPPPGKIIPMIDEI
jgi:hypothetical protein